MNKFKVGSKFLHHGVMWEIVYVTPKPGVDNHFECLYLCSDTEYDENAKCEDYILLEENEIEWAMKNGIK